MHTFTVTLTEEEHKALAYVAVDPQEWIDNAVHERCRLAIEEIVQQEIQRMMQDPNTTEIPADKAAVVLAANIKSAAERNAEIMAEQDGAAVMPNPQ